MDEILTRLNIHKHVRLIKGDAEVMPMTWGTIRPIVLLPRVVDDWSEERSRVVLTHEAAHIRRLDHFTQAIARCAVAIHWFNPFVGFAAKALRIESERACDDLTLALGETPSTYADVLLQTARSYRVSAYSLGTAGIAVARKSRLEARVSAILDPMRNRQEISRRSLIAVVSIFLLISILLGSIRPTARTAFAAPPKTEARSKVNEIVKRPSGPMSFGGRVIDLETKKPIEGAKIVVNRNIPGIDPKDSPAWIGDETLRSDADGRFTLTFTAEQIA
jgi:beta-lactamase regulating signal transducer with metallopeptidase domain